MGIFKCIGKPKIFRTFKLENQWFSLYKCFVQWIYSGIGHANAMKKTGGCWKCRLAALRSSPFAKCIKRGQGDVPHENARHFQEFWKSPISITYGAWPIHAKMLCIFGVLKILWIFMTKKCKAFLVPKIVLQFSCITNGQVLYKNFVREYSMPLNFASLRSYIVKGTKIWAIDMPFAYPRGIQKT